MEPGAGAVRLAPSNGAEMGYGEVFGETQKMPWGFNSFPVCEV